MLVSQSHRASTPKQISTCSVEWVFKDPYVLNAYKVSNTSEAFSQGNTKVILTLKKKQLSVTV